PAASRLRARTSPEPPIPIAPPRRLRFSRRTWTTRRGEENDMRKNRMRIAVLAAVTLAATAAFAGGPLYTFDYSNKIPYVWHMDNPPNGAVPYYTDLGSLGRLSNSVANGLVDRAFAEWNNVPTSSILTANAGNFSTIGLPDIVCPNAANCNANLVIGPY